MDISVAFSDTHIPYHDKLSYSAMLDAFTDLNPNQILIGGDFLDCHNIGRWGKNLNIEETLQEEIEAGIAELCLLRKKFPRSKVVYLFGNHEQRLEKYIMRKCGELWKMLELQRLLCLKEIGIDYIPYGPSQRYTVGTYTIKHAFTGAVSTAAQRAGCNLIFGHSHKLGESRFTSLNGAEYHAINSGHLCDISNQAFAYLENYHQWQQGFVVIEENNGICTAKSISIKDHKFILNGKLYGV